MLPRGARELVEVIGLRPTLELLHQFGGGRLTVPVKLDPDSRFVREVGPDVAAKLVQAAPGCTIEPPTLAAVEKLLRDNAIRHDFDSGASVNELVLRYGVTHRHVRTLLRASTATAPRAALHVGHTSKTAN